MASQQVTIDHAVAPYTCKVQGAITTPALAPFEGERSVFGQIYIMDSAQDQAITRSVHIWCTIGVVFNSRWRARSKVIFRVCIGSGSERNLILSHARCYLSLSLSIALMSAV